MVPPPLMMVIGVCSPACFSDMPSRMAGSGV